MVTAVSFLRSVSARVRPSQRTFCSTRWADHSALRQRTTPPNCRLVSKAEYPAVWRLRAVVSDRFPSCKQAKSISLAINSLLRWSDLLAKPLLTFKLKIENVGPSPG